MPGFWYKGCFVLPPNSPIIKDLMQAYNDGPKLQEREEEIRFVKDEKKMAFVFPVRNIICFSRLGGGIKNKGICLHEVTDSDNGILVPKA